jgi:hypothetical protein
MTRRLFGWDLPPGCTQRHIDEAAGSDVAPDCKCEKPTTQDWHDFCTTCGGVLPEKCCPPVGMGPDGELNIVSDDEETFAENCAAKEQASYDCED